MDTDVSILVLYSSLASDTWISRVLDTFRNLVTRRIVTVEVPSSIGFEDIDEDRYRISVDGRYTLVLCLGIPPDLLLEVPEVARRVEAEAILVPVEDHRWAPLGLQNQVKELCSSYGIECVFPKPFCSFSTAQSRVLRYVLERVGRPIVRIEVENGVARNIDVVRTAPCGATLELAKMLIGRPIDEIPRLAGLYNSSLCLASRAIDPLIGDSLNHVSSYIASEAFREALSRS